MAERVGFEPTEGLTLRRFSRAELPNKQQHSQHLATLAPASSGPNLVAECGLSAWVLSHVCPTRIRNFPTGRVEVRRWSPSCGARNLPLPATHSARRGHTPDLPSICAGALRDGGAAGPDPSTTQ